MKNLPTCSMVGASALLLSLVAGCASTETMQRDQPDPLEPYNRVVFRINDTVDKALLRPLAQGYEAITPKPVNTAISNFFNNLGDVVVVTNDLLQGKVDQAARDSTRLVFNTTFGLGGLIDFASLYMDLPKNHEDFGQTLSVWTGREGYYFIVPLLGPSTTLDAPGRAGDTLVQPLSYAHPMRLRYALRGIEVVDLRADLLRAERAVGDTQIDPYTFQREAYLQRRRFLIYDGNPPRARMDWDDEEVAKTPLPARMLPSSSSPPSE